VGVGVGAGVGAGVELPPHPATTATAAAAPERAMKLRRLIALSISSINFLSTTYLSHLKNRVMPVPSTGITRYLSNAVDYVSDCNIPIPFGIFRTTKVAYCWIVTSLLNRRTRRDSKWIFADCGAS